MFKATTLQGKVIEMSEEQTRIALGMKYDGMMIDSVIEGLKAGKEVAFAHYTITYTK